MNHLKGVASILPPMIITISSVSLMSGSQPRFPPGELSKMKPKSGGAEPRHEDDKHTRRGRTQRKAGDGRLGVVIWKRVVDIQDHGLRVAGKITAGLDLDLGHGLQAGPLPLLALGKRSDGDGENKCPHKSLHTCDWGAACMGISPTDSRPQVTVGLCCYSQRAVPGVRSNRESGGRGAGGVSPPESCN
ncbi:hypothetical protein EYF80_054500 [Liparis tanakae]|uniref:Uncharacterized protein n=1 Tax=Liparis tanakae TaxID=230148 RepID=A0A4Z2F364_9TELE|nr:hypothetical protein EYF80_054500 [Liparis tanakae]